MLVSILIPTYNQAQLVGKAIESALLQNYTPIEVIVLDDCSTDDTADVLNAYPASAALKVYRNDTNLGRVATYRKLLYELSSGVYAVNLDGDDYFTDPDFISTAVQKLEAYPRAVFYQATIAARSDKHNFHFSHKLLKGKEEELWAGNDYFQHFYENEYFGHLATVYRTALAKPIGFYAYECLSADAESMLKLALHGSVYLQNKEVGVWNIHNANESGAALKKNDETVQMLQRIRNYAATIAGAGAAEQWYHKAYKANLKSYLSLLYKDHFSLFLNTVAKEKYFNPYVAKLLLKKILGR
jgi:glycosyltransferase involved in cell wall biosynthesis